MDPYEELLARREELEAQIVAMRASRRPDVIGQIGRLMQEYEISVEEVTDWQGRHEEGRDRRRGRVAPRYVDPETGATWTGRGKRPRWMGQRDPEEFLIPEGVSTSVSVSTSVEHPPPDELTRALYGTARAAPKPAPGARARHEASAAPPLKVTPGFPSGSLVIQASKGLQGLQSTIRRTK